MSCSKERSRVPNFNNSEKLHLLTIIGNKYAKVLEDKKTDRASNYEKEKAWQLIESEFNASSATNIYRTAASLKKCYENRKKEIKKTLADERKETVLTGGGPPPKIKKNDTDEILMTILNKKTLVGLHNPFDDDADESTVMVAGTSNTIEYEFLSDDYHLLNDGSKTEENTQENTSPAPEAASSVTWEKYTPAKLHNAISTPLLFKDSASQPPKECTFTKSEQTPKKDSSRRRPTTIIKPLTSSDIAKKYNLLLDRRLQILESQLKQQETIHNLNATKVELEIKILKIELAKKEKDEANN